MPLEKYRAKRRFDKTWEPKGELVEKGEYFFVVQKHQASHLHWDFRLELPENTDGSGFWVLKSWAIPKEPPQEAGVKRLAVQVEDHPVDYLDFEGEIPEGQYGAGRVEIWDSGNFNLIQRTGDKLEFELFGQKLKGFYVLVRTKMGGNSQNWLLFKKQTT